MADVSSTPLLLRIEEVAKVLNLGRSTIYMLIRDGSLPTIKVGRATRISVQAVALWVEQQSAASDAEAQR